MENMKFIVGIFDSASSAKFCKAKLAKILLDYSDFEDIVLYPYKSMDKEFYRVHVSKNTTNLAELKKVGQKFYNSIKKTNGVISLKVDGWELIK